MASVLDLYQAPDTEPELVGPPEPPKKKPTVLDLYQAHQPPPPAAPPTGSRAGALFGAQAERERIPELIRRPEEPETVAPPRPDEPPEYLKRPAYEEAPAGAYGKPTTAERVLLPAARIGAPILASSAGALTGPGAPVVSPLLGAAASTATELGAQKYEKARGLRREVSPGGVAFQGALGAFQGVPLGTTLTAPARIAARTGEGALFGTGATAGQTLIEEHRLPTAGELATGAGMGAAFGAAGGTFEAKGVPYLHERSPEFMGPREFPSGRQLRATRKALATSAEQLAGETTAPPVGEPQRMVTRPGETIGTAGDDVATRLAAEPEAPTGFVGPTQPVPLPETTIRDPNGAPKKVYHGTPRPFENFSGENLSSDALFGPGVYLTDNPNVAGEYADSSRVVNQPMSPADRRAHFTPGRIIESGYVNVPPDKVLGYTETPDGRWSVQVVAVNPDGTAIYGERPRVHSSDPTYPPARSSNIRPAYADVRNPLNVDTPEGGQLYAALLREHDGDKTAVTQALQEQGYDGIVYEGGRRMGAGEPAHQVVVAFSPDQVHDAFSLEAAARHPMPDIGPPVPPDLAPPPPPPGREAPPPGAPGEGEGGQDFGPWGRPPTFRRYAGLGEALTGEEIPPQGGADPERMTRAIESIDREFSDVFDEPTRERLKQQVRDNEARFEYLGRGSQSMARTQGLARDLVFDLEAAKLEPKGTTWNAEQKQAASNHIASLDATIREAGAAYDADPTPQNGLILQKAEQDQIDAFTILRARGAEAGRMVNMFKASAEELASGNQRLMMAGLRRGVPPDKLAEIIRSTKPENVMQRAKMLLAFADRGPWHKRIRDVLNTGYISNILSGFKPHERNLLGNSIRAYLLTPTAQKFAGAYERFIQRVPEGERLIYSGESAKHFVGMRDSIPEAIEKAQQILIDGYTLEDRKST